MNLERRSIKLNIKLWKRLDEIAKETDSISSRGITSGQPSWRTLLRRIAEGKLMVAHDD